ncbi:MAG: carbohydrate-binding family 9-like protein [Proteobacteria bacterium]|nr:carbohydrate-binding family 9-like protein [Pseudomonadota bacterium]
MRRELCFIACLATAAWSACVDQGPGPTRKKIDPSYIKRNLLSQPPVHMTNLVHADFDGKVVYLGNDLPSNILIPGQPAHIVHYWQVVEPPGGQWRVFVHLEGKPGHGKPADSKLQDWLNLGASDMRIGYGPDKWRAGDILRDEQEIRLPTSWSSPAAQLVVGLFRKGGQTVADRMPVRSQPKGQPARVTVAQFQVDKSKTQAQQNPNIKAAKKPTKPVYVIRKAQGPIILDGRADEDAWKRASSSPAFATAEGSPAIKGETRARLLWNEQTLYLFVEAKDPDVFSQYRNHDDPLWKEDVVEIFIDADRNHRGYVELQVNPNNAHFDSWFATTRASKADPAWNANMQSAVFVHGTADNRDDTDTGWDAELAIPLAAVKGRDSAMAVHIPPRPGDTWRLNVVRIDKPRGEKSRLAVSSWNKITYRDFHALGRMLEVQFGDQTGNTRPPAPTPPAKPQPRAR